MPQYQIDIFGLKIRYIHVNKNIFGKIKTVDIVPEDPAYPVFPVSVDWYKEHQPTAGGYYASIDNNKIFITAFYFEAKSRKIKEGE